MIINTIISCLTNNALDFLRRTWYIWVIAILCILLAGSCAKEQLLEAKLDISEKNYKESERKTSRITKEFQLKEAEYDNAVQSSLDETKWLKDSLNSLNIKVKNINKYQRYTSVKTIRDTLVEVKWRNVSGMRYNEVSKEGCNFKVSAGWFEGDTIATINTRVTTDIALINYWNRKRLWGVKIFPKWGKKKYESIVIDKCSQDTIITNQTFNRLK